MMGDQTFPPSLLLSPFFFFNLSPVSKGSLSMVFSRFPLAAPFHFPALTSMTPRDEKLYPSLPCTFFRDFNRPHGWFRICFLWDRWSTTPRHHLWRSCIFFPLLECLISILPIYYPFPLRFFCSALFPPPSGAKGETLDHILKRSILAQPPPIVLHMLPFSPPDVTKLAA